mmetsp:Transcript_3580/g.8476  ORF Transcript_3580/g.8476 Transcript_3580/m.8476 type:complete len:971 (-) Transcript_3580:569-3481(-)
MTSTVFNVISKRWNRKTPNNLFFDFTTNMLVIEKDLDQPTSREKKFPASVVSAVVNKDEVTVKITVETMQYSKDVVFSKRYEAKNFCVLLKRLQHSRGTAYRIFKEACSGKETLSRDKLHAAMQKYKIRTPEAFKPMEQTDFESFLGYYVQYGPKEQLVGATSSHTAKLKNGRERRGVRTRSLTALPSTSMLFGEEQIIKPSHVALMLSEDQMRDGVLTLTNYRILLQENLTLETLSIPVASIKTIETKKRGKKLQDLVVSCKDFRQIVFVYDPSTKPLNVLAQSVRMMAFPEKQEKLFAFSYRLQGRSRSGPRETKEAKPNKQEDGMVDGWSLYTVESDAERMRLLDKTNYLRLTEKNVNYKWSPTYPARCVIPGNITDDQLDKIGKFRSKARIPSVVWIHPETKATITRCAQPMGGMSGSRCLEDEMLINALRVINPTNNNVIKFFDARPKIAALGNKAMGKGFENVNHYDSAEIEFLGIDNIHHVRNSMDSLMAVCLSPENLDTIEWHTKLAQSKWLHHIRQILMGANRIVNCVEVQGASCVVHCSDGWDRTAQLTSLAEILLDPHYRTLKGFATLMEKEWISYGHNFEERIGHGHAEIHDHRSPVFVQFIDCVWQIHRQFPLNFEFTEEFLISILDHLYDCRFGTFLYNFESQRAKADYKKRTESLWSFMLSAEQADTYKNYLYQYCDHKERTLQLSTDSRRVVLWEAYHLRYNKEFLDNSQTPAVAAMQNSANKSSGPRHTLAPSASIRLGRAFSFHHEGKHISLSIDALEAGLSMSNSERRKKKRGGSNNTSACNSPRLDSASWGTYNRTSVDDADSVFGVDDDPDAMNGDTKLLPELPSPLSALLAVDAAPLPPPPPPPRHENSAESVSTANLSPCLRSPPKPSTRSPPSSRIANFGLSHGTASAATPGSEKMTIGSDVDVDDRKSRDSAPMRAPPRTPPKPPRRLRPRPPRPKSPHPKSPPH